MVQKSEAGFFLSKRGAAILKHQILERYLPVFVSKVGSGAPGKRVVYIDGFAGEGMYGDASEGSPLLAVRALKRLAGIRAVSFHFVERRRGAVQKLRTALDGVEANVCIHHGEAEGIVPGIVQSSGSLPLFAFLDPFGHTGMSFELTSGILKRAGSMPGSVTSGITELLLRFPRGSLERIGGLLKHSEDTRPESERKTIEGLDRSMGGLWWHPMWKDGDKLAAREIRRQFRLRLAAAGGNGHGSIDVPVPQRWGAKAAYELHFFSAHPHGHWEFLEAVSCAREHQKDLLGAGQPSLLSADDLFVDEIDLGLRDLCGKGKPFSVIENPSAVFRRSLGLARGKHLNKALRRLEKEGVLTVARVKYDWAPARIITPKG